MSTLDELRQILAADYKVSEEALVPDALLGSLGIDSLGMLELMFKIEDRYHVKIIGDPPTDLVTVGDVVVYIDALIAAQPAPRAAPAPGGDPP